MRRFGTLALVSGILALAVIAAVGSSRQALAVGSQTRTFVATTGSDANLCTRVAPCRTFGAALAQTASGGEIVALDSGGYGAVTVTQAVSIAAAPGVQASISPASGNAIAVAAGPTDKVTLRNLQLNGQGATHGVIFTAGGALFIDDLTINGFGGHGIFTSVAGSADLYVTDTVIRGAGDSGIYLESDSGFLNATVVRTRLEENAVSGLFSAVNSRVTVKDTVAIGSGTGFYAGPGDMYLEGCVARNNQTGVEAANSIGSQITAIVHVSNCIVTGNLFGWILGTNGGSVLSRGNNTLEGNTFSNTFSGTYSPK
jgi:hypothetical protein